MGRLSPFSSSIILGIALFILTVLTPNHAAPVQDSAVSSQVDERGCYFMNKRYPSGHEIDTNEPCLNCTCVESTLMCYLRVCPFIKPVGENCVSEMHVGDCCPKYWCPEVYPRITTEAPETVAKGCYLDGRYYTEGDRLPMNPVKPCEACYCIRNTSVCTMQTCELSIDGCFPQYKVGSCCPARYNCTDDAATTIPPGVMDAEHYEGCLHNGKMYKDGEQVPSEVKCNQCYCMKHSVVCAVASCKAPAENCVPHETPDGQCCPEKYDCPEGTEIPDSATTHMITTEEEFLNLTTLYKTSSTLTTASVSASAADEDLTSGVDAESFSTTEPESLYPTTKGIRRIDDADLVSTFSTVDGMMSTEDELSKTTEKTIPPAPRVTTRRPVFFPSRPIPGEGVCRHRNKTYQNGENFESDDPCLKNCTCMHSVVKCDTLECVLEPPKAGINCKVKRIPEECCPVYVCDVPLSSPLPDETEDGQQQEILDSQATTPKTEQQEIIPESESTTLKTEVQEVTIVHDIDQQTVVDALVTTVGTKELDQTTVSDSTASTSTTEVSITDVHSLSTETDGLSKETTTTSDEIITKSDLSQETVSDKATVTKLETTLAAGTVTPLIITSTTEASVTAIGPESTQTDVPLTETTTVGEEVFTEVDHSQETVPEKDTVTKLETTLAAETVPPLTTLTSATEETMTSTYSTPTQSEVSHKETTVVSDETPTKTEQPETGETKFEESLAAETGTPFTTEESVTDKTIAPIDDAKTEITFEDEITTTPLKTADKDIPITDEELKSDFSTTIGKDSITKDILSTKTIPKEISTESAETSTTMATTTEISEVDKDTDATRKTETTTISLGETSDEMRSTAVTTGLELTTIFKQETTSDILQTAVTKEKEADTTLLQTDEAYSSSTEGEVKVDQSTLTDEESTTKQTELSTKSEQISTERMDTKPTIATTTVEEKKDIDVSKESDITTSLADKFDKVSSTTEATEFDLASTVGKETTTVTPQTIITEDKETSATHLQTDEEAISSTEEGLKLHLSTVVDEDITTKHTILPGEISTERPDTAKPTTTIVEEKDASVTKETEITSMSDKFDMVSSTTKAIVPESTAFEKETSIDMLQTTVTDERVSDKLTTPEISEITTEGEIRKTTFELEADTTEKTTITFEPQTSTEVKEDITSMLTTKISSDVTPETSGSKDTETVTQEIPVTQEAEKVTPTSEIVPVKETETETKTETFPTEDVKKVTLEEEIITTEFPQKVTSKPEDLSKDITSKTSYSEILTTDGIELTTKFEAPVAEEFKTTLKPITIKTEEAETISPVTDEEERTSATEEKRIVTKDGVVSSTEVTTTPRISEPTIAFTATTSSETLESETKPSDLTTESEDKKLDTSDTPFDHEETEKSASEVDTTTMTSVISMKPTLSSDKTETESTEVEKFTSPEIPATTGTVKPSTVTSEVTKLSITTLKAETEKDKSTETLETDITETTTFRDETTSISKTSPFDTTTPEQTESEMAFETSEIPDRTEDTLKKSTFGQEFTDKLTTRFEWSSPVFSTVTSTSVPSHLTEELFEITDIGTTLFDGEEKDEDRVKTTESKDETEITPSDITSSKLSTESTTQSHVLVTKEKDILTTEKSEEKVTFTTTEEVPKDLTELKTTLSDFETSKEETVSEITPKTDKTDLPMDTKTVELSTLVTEAPDLVTNISIKTEVTGSTESAATEVEETKKADVSTESAVPSSITTPSGETDIVTSTIVTGLTSEKTSSLQDTEVTMVKKTDMDDRTQEVFKTETTKVFSSTPSQEQTDFVTLTESITEGTASIGTKQEPSDLDKFETDSLEGVTEVVSEQAQDTTTKLEGEDFKTTTSATVFESSKVITTEKEEFTSHSITEEITTVSKLETITPDSEISSSSPLPLTSTPKPEDLDSEISSATEITKISETADIITDTLFPVHGAEATTSETSLITEYQESTKKTDTEETEIMPTKKSITRVSSEILPTVSETAATFPTSVDKETSVPFETTTEKLELDFTLSTEGVKISSATEMTDKTSEESDKELDLQPETVLPTTEKVKPEEGEIALTVVEEETTMTVSKLPVTTASHTSTEIPSSTMKITEKPTTMSISTSAPSEETADAMTTIKISDTSFPETEDLESKTTIKFDTEKPSTISKDIIVESQSPKDDVVTVTLSTLKDLEEKDITTSTFYDISETSDHTVSTLETEIITDNVFTPMKHLPDSLIREKSTIPETKTDTTTSSPMSEKTESVSLTDLTQKAETASAVEFSKTESGFERSTTQDTQHETVTEKAFSEIPSKVELTEPSEAEEIIKDKTISVPDITTVITVGTLDDREIKTTGTVPSDVPTKATISSISLSETETSTTEVSLESAATTEKPDRTTISVELSTGTQETEKDERLTVTDTDIQKETLHVSTEISTEVSSKATDFISSTKVGVTSAVEEDTTETTSEKETEGKITEETAKSTLTTKMFSTEATGEDKFTTEILSSTKDSDLMFPKQTDGFTLAAVTDSETEISTTYKYDEVSTKSTSVEIDKKVTETISESVLTTLPTVTTPEPFETESEMLITKSEVPSESEETDMTSDRDGFGISSVSVQETKTAVHITTTEVLAGETTTPSKETETDEVSIFTSEKMDVTDTLKIEATTDKISTTITEDQAKISSTKEAITTESSVTSETEPTVETKTLSQTIKSEIITTESSPPSHITENVTFDEKLEITKFETLTPESLLVTKLVTLPDIAHSTITSSSIEEISTSIPVLEERKTTLPPVDSHISTAETISLDAETLNDTSDADIVTVSVPSDFTTRLTSDLEEKSEIPTHIDLERNFTESTIIVSTTDLHDLTTKHTTKVQTTLTDEDTTTAAGKISITTVEGADDTDRVSSTPIPQEDAKSTATFEAEPVSSIKPFITEVEDHLTTVTEIGIETTETTPKSDTVSDHLLFDTTRQSESPTEESVKFSPTDIKLTTILDKRISISDSVSPEITEPPITSDIPKDLDKESTAASKEIFKESTTVEKDIFSLETETVTLESEASSTKERVTTEEIPIITSPIPELETGKISTEKTTVTEAELIDKISLTTDEEASTLMFETEQTTGKTDMKTTSTKMSSETEVTEKIDTSVSTTTEKPTESGILSTQAIEITTPEPKVITDFEEKFTSVSSVSEKELTTISEEFDDSKTTTVTSEEQSTTMLSSTPASTDLDKSVTELAETEKEILVSSEPSTLSTSKEKVEVTTGIFLKESTTTERATVDVEEKVFTETSVFTERSEATTVKKSTEKEEETPESGETTEMHVVSSTVSVPVMTEKVPEIFSTVQTSEVTGTEEKEISVTEDVFSPETTIKFDKTSDLTEKSTLGTSKAPEKTEILLTDVTSQDITKITTVAPKDEFTTEVTSTTQRDFKISDTTLPEKGLDQTEEPKVSLGTEISESSTKKETDLPGDSLETTLKDSKLETTPSLELQTLTSLTSDFTTKQLLKIDTSSEIPEVSTKPVTVPETIDLKTLSERTEASTTLSELEEKTSTIESVTEIKKITDIKQSTTMTVDEITTSSSIDLDLSSEKEISSTTDKTEDSTEFMTKSDVGSTEVKASTEEFIKTSPETATPPEKNITVMPLSESDKTTDESEKKVVTTEPTTFDLELKVTKLSTVDKTETTSRDDEKTKSLPSSTTTEFLETITDEYDVIKESDIDKENVTVTISEAEEITEKDFMSTTSKISDMVTKPELDQSTYITLKDLTSTEETVGITTLKSFETTEKKLFDLTDKTREVYTSSEVTPTEASTTDKVSGTESDVFTTKTTEFVPNITELVRQTEAETDVSYAIAHSLSTMKPDEKTEVTTEVSDADTTSVTLKVKTTEPSDISETKVVAETTEKVTTQTSVSGEDITVTKPTAEEDKTALPIETESPVDDGSRTEIPSSSQTTKKTPLPEEISTVASTSSGKPLTSTPHFVEITSPEEEITTQREISTVGVETTTEHTVVTEEIALKNATFEIDSLIKTSSTTEPSITTFIGNDTEEESFTRDDSAESSLKTTTYPSTSVTKTDIPEDLVSDVTSPSKITSSEMGDAETVQTESTSVTSTKVSVDTEKHATVEESLQTSPVSEKITTLIPPVSEFASLPSEMTVDTITEKISSLEPEEKITTMHSTDASDIYSDSELPEGFFSRRDEKIDTVTTEVSEIPTESDIYTSTFSEDLKTTLKKEIIENISTTKSIKTETKATTSIEVDEFATKDTEMTPEVSKTVSFKFTTEPVTDSIIETDITKDSEATTLGAREETTLFDLKETTISSDTSSSQATFDVTEEVFTAIQTDKAVDEQDIKSSEIPKEVTMIETEETPEGPTPSPDIRISTASGVADDSVTKITKYSPTTTQASETTTASVEGKTEYPAKTIFTTDRVEVKETRLDASETTEIDELKTSTFAVSTKEYPVETESPPSKSTMVPSEVITDGTTPEKSISTDSERKDFISETKALPEVETSTEVKFDILSTTLSPEIPKTEVDTTFDMKDDCMINGTTYKDGEAIITIDPCEKCHCSLGEIRCFKILCKLPKEGCKPNISSTSECCPSSYECPEEDKSIHSTTTMHSVSDKDLTTPIPISFMFSTTPKSIASTMLITKLDDLTESTEETTSEKLETILSKDMTSTLTDVPSKVTEETISEEVITDSPTVHSTSETSDLFPPSTSSSAETITLSVISKQDNQTSDTDVEATEAIEEEMSTTLRDDLTRETVTIISSTVGEATTTERSTSRIDLTSTDGKEKISEVTKQTTETPTTFDTIKTTFEATQEEKEGETTLVPDSTTTSYSTTMESNLTTAFETVSSTGIVFEDKITKKAETMLPITVREDKTTEKAITEQDKITTQMLGETTTVRVDLSSAKEETGTLPDFTKEIILEKMSTTIAPKIITTEETGSTEIITIKENLTTTTPTAMPSKLPKLDDILTSTMETRPETLSTIFTEDKKTKEVTMTEITERKTTIEESTVSSFETTDSRVTLKDSDIKVSTESGAAVTEDVSSTKTSFVDEDATTITLSSEDVSTSERVNETTEEELLSTLFGSPTKEPTSVDISTVTKNTLLSETTDSLMTSSLFDTKEDTLPTETISTPEEVLGIHKELDVEDKYFTEKDKFNTTSSALPTFASIPEETTEFEIITEMSITNKTIPSLDKEGTEKITEKEILTSTVSIPITRMDETIGNKTTDFEEETEKVETASTLSDITDKIFTFVSTRFTDLMKGTEELTTLTPQKETDDASKKQTTVIPTSEFSTEKVDESVTPFISLTRRIDLEIDRTTLEGSTSQDAEITQSPLFEQTTSKELATKSKDESTSDTVGNATTVEATFKSTETPEDILTTISSIITSLKQETVTPSSLAEKPVTSTMQEAFSETTKETRSTDDEGKFRTTEKSRVELTTIPDSATSRTKAQTKDADVSSTSITQEFDTEIVKTVSTFKEYDMSTSEPVTQPISVTTESEEEVSDYTKIPSRATRKDVRFETTPASFTGTEEQETKVTDQQKDITRVDDDQSTTKEAIDTTTRYALSSTSESSTPSPVTTISDKFDLPTLSTLFSILTNESTAKTDLETNETSSTPFEEKTTATDEDIVTSEISETTVKEVTQEITEQTKSTSDIGEQTTVSLSPKIETTEFEDDQISQKVKTMTEEVFTSESSKITEKETGRTESIEQTEKTVSGDENITEPSEVTVKLEAETFSEAITTSEIPKTTEAEARTESTEQSELTPTASEKTTLVTKLDRDVTTAVSDIASVTQVTQTVRGETSKASDIPMTTETKDRTESTKLPIPTQKIDEKSEEPTVVTKKAETASETVFTESEATKVTEKETFTTREEKITPEPTTATITMKADTISEETSTPAEIPRTAGKEITTESVEQPKLTTRMDEISSTAVKEESEKTMTEAEATITAEAEAISTVTYDKESSTKSETPETSSEVSSPVSREEVNTTLDLTKGPKAIDTTPASHVTTPYSSTADIETTTIQEEEDYLVDENTCIFEGRIYQSAEQIPRPDPCEFCFCFRGDIICLQQSCPPPLPNCQQTSIPGYCCPRYECPVYLASKNISQLSRRKGVNPIIIQKRIDKREIARPVVEVKGCQINGTFYEMGKTVTSASGPCLHCVCQEDGFLHCDPQRCKPQPPLMLKMNSNYFRR